MKKGDSVLFLRSGFFLEYVLQVSFKILDKVYMRSEVWFMIVIFGVGIGSEICEMRDFVPRFYFLVLEITRF